MVGLDRLELSTSPLSGVRSNHLSYRPGSARRPGTSPNANGATPKVSVKKKEKRRRRRPANEVHPKMASMIQVDQPTNGTSPIQSLADHP
jgi:hypothetical protein